MSTKNIVRLSPGQLVEAWKAVAESARWYMPGGGYAAPSAAPWVDLEVVDLPDLQLLSVRFPGRYVPSAVQHDPNEGGEPWYGVYVALVDQQGVIRALQHSAGGPLVPYGSHVESTRTSE